MPTHITTESDSDLSDNQPGQCSPTGDVNVAVFPATPPGPDEAKKRAADRAKTAPSGGDSTKQAFAVGVPYSGTTLAIGSSASAGGSGASLTTGGNALIDATGTLTAQSAASFTAQTNAAMQLLSVAGTKAHAQAKFEIFAGGGSAPGACGAGGAAGAGPSNPPATSAEAWTNVAANAVGVLKATNELVSLERSDGDLGVPEMFTVFKTLADWSNKGMMSNVAMVAPKGSGPTEAPKYLDAASGGLGAAGGIAKAIASGDIAGGVSSVISGASSIAGAFGLTSAALGGGGGAGAADIEARASGSIKQTADMKVYGNAPEGIDWKTATKFSVNAVSNVDFATTNWGAFAAAKFELKCGGLTEITCRRFEFKGFASGKVTAGASMTITCPANKLDGALTITKTLTVVKATHLHAKLSVTEHTHLQKNLTVESKAEYKDRLKVDKTGTFKKGVTIKGRLTGHGKVRVQRNAKLS